ncbi:MAG: cobyric acid synthase [Lachnospiraceae bacterium]|nr:cobyric acid synthase [Lachnospiraceae bacterium]
MSSNIMLQGTMSGVGKSLLTAALCRIFSQDGYETAPFKSQNMALNSFVTKEGLEMGRAQVLQAAASGKEPDVRMNPILLKPSDESGSQLIVMGKVRGQYKAIDYFRKKRSLIPEIMEAYNSLEAENDIIVIEGAGSPAEINLKSEDIVNMGLAELTDAPVILIGDIDPGGVFAQLYGTIALLSEDEKRRVKGLIINKFRGDKSLLEDGINQIEKKLKIPVIGLIPYIKLYIDEEDSQSESLKTRSHNRLLDLAVIKLPYISNYTDFLPIESSELMGLRYVEDVRELGRPDLLIIPGSKSTPSDLKWLKDRGFEGAIRALSKSNTPILGICGGYQILGSSIYDEESGEELKGLDLLPIHTDLRPGEEKIRRQTHARVNSGFLKGAAVEGYEIHTGVSCLRDTSSAKDSPFLLKDDGSYDGYCLDNIMGTYIHGLFDKGELLSLLEKELLKRRGLYDKNSPYLKAKDSYDHKSFLEGQLDLLAETVKKSLDMEKLYHILFEKKEDLKAYPKKEPKSPYDSKGLIQLYHGDGKGKTTAACGLSLRALRAGYKVIIFRLLKGSDSGELESLKDLGALVINGKTDNRFIKDYSKKELEELRKRQDRIFKELEGEIEALSKKNERILYILDELLSACSKSLIDEEMVKSFIENKGENVEIVMTGRGPKEWMLNIADYVSEIKAVKHPYNRGIIARKGIEY